MPLDPREKRFLAGGAGVAVALLAYLLWPAEGDGGTAELVPADQRPAVQAAAPSVHPEPIAAPVLPPTPVAAAPPASAGPEGLSLHGVMASGAVIGFPDGSQRYVAVGGEFMPGLRLQAVRMHHAILATATTNYRLGFAGGASAIQSPSAPATAAAAAATAPPPPQIIDRQLSATAAAERTGVASLRRALVPRSANGQVTGFEFSRNFDAPALRSAGLQPGDLIVAMNGSPLNASRMEEMVFAMGNGTPVEFEVERGNRRLRLTARSTR